MITAGDVLKNKRESLGKSLETVSLDTKIQRRFIKYMENNQFSYFDSEVFLTGFIKIYAQYLNLDVDKVLALYRRSNPKKKETFQNKEKKTFKKKIRLNIFNPKTLITILLVLFLAGIIGYIGFQIYKFQSPPSLSISQPVDDEKFEEEEIVVKGKSEPNTTIEINGSPTEISSDGRFEKSIKLKEGVNIITVKARKDGNNTLESVETRKVTYNKENKQEEIEQEDEKRSILTLEITDSNAWIRLDIDDENKLSQVVEPSKLEYEVVEKVYIITGRVSSTKLYYNDQLIEWKSTQTAGVAELTCQIQEFSISCQ